MIRIRNIESLLPEVEHTTGTCVARVRIIQTSPKPKRRRLFVTGVWGDTYRKKRSDVFLDEKSAISLPRYFRQKRNKNDRVSHGLPIVPIRPPDISTTRSFRSYVRNVSNGLKNKSNARVSARIQTGNNRAACFKCNLLLNQSPSDYCLNRFEY